MNRPADGTEEGERGRPHPGETLGAWLRSQRNRAHLSQRQLAANAGMSVRALRDIEQDRVHRPRSDSVLRLAAALGLDDTEACRLLAATNPDRAAEALADLRIAVLGPLGVQHGQAVEPIASPMLRRLLGLLALRYPGAIGHAELVDALWPDGPPRSCRTLVHVYIRQLRALLEPGRRSGQPAQSVVHLHGTFRLNLRTDQLDLAEFDELTARARQAQESGDLASAQQLLTRALRCWRGPVLDDADPALRQHPAAIAASERRLGAALSHADVAMAVGRPDEAVETLRAFTLDAPLHEGLHARLMLALACCGGQAAALKLFATLRTRLDDELGIEPSGEVRDAHLRILRQQLPARTSPPSDRGPDRLPDALAEGAAPARPAGSAPSVPAQLPADAATYVGRGRQLRQLDDLLPSSAAAGPATTLMIVGPAGVGKTALAMHWAHRVRDQFSDGQLFVDLRGHAPVPPLRPIEVLAQFLRALGVPVERVPANLDEAAGMYRTLVAGRRMLIVLDNAGSVDQVRPLLPASPGCVVLVTSRSRLSGLVARNGARRLTLDVLSPDEANVLLVQLLGVDRFAAEPQAIVELARTCAWLPLAIRIAAANLTTHAYGSVAAYCAELRAGNLLSGLEVDGDDQSAVRAAFDLSYLAQSEATRRMFRLIGLMPGSDIAIGGAAALAETTPAETAKLLRRLAEVHLIEERPVGRFALHDLIRCYAGELVSGEEAVADRRAALVRLYDWYLSNVDSAARLLYPEKLRLPSTVNPSHEPSQAYGAEADLHDHKDASAWLDAERSNLVSAVAHAVEHRLPQVATHLADSLHGYFSLSMHTLDWLSVAETGLAAAESCGDLRAQAAAHLSLADCHWIQGHTEDALKKYADALELARQGRWSDGEAAALGNLGVAHKEEGRLQEAFGFFTQAYALTKHTGRPEGKAANVVNLGLLSWKLGRLADAADYYTRAADLFREIASPSGEGVSLTNLGMIYRAMGRPEQARDVGGTALNFHRETGNRGSEAVALCSLAGVYTDLGDHARALELAKSARSTAREIGHKRLEANALNAAGDVFTRMARDAQAVESYQEALHLAITTNDRQPEVHALIGLATAELCLGWPQRALPHIRDAIALTRRAGFRVYEGRALTAFAAVRLEIGDTAAAVHEAEAALAVHRETGHRPGEARTHLVLGAAAARLGQDTRAFAHWRQARGLFAAMGMPDFVELRARHRALRDRVNGGSATAPGGGRSARELGDG